MNHNYKITEFKSIVNEVDTDIKDRIVSVGLGDIPELPICIVYKIETLINEMIADQEEKNGDVIPLDEMELGIYLEVDTYKNELSLNAYIGYSIDKECITGKEVIMPDAMDKNNYMVIKRFFFSKLLGEVFGQIKKIAECVQ